MRLKIACLTALSVVFAAMLIASASPPGARAEGSGRTDILLLLDTSGSMEGALGSAVSDVQEISDRVRSELGDVEFGVAQVRDYPISIFENGGSGDLPYEVVQPITGDRGSVASALGSLFAGGGGDAPEAYGRALRDADSGSGLGWRPGARRLVILVADNVPHDDDLNWGVPESAQAFPSPFDTIRDPGDDEIVGTGDDIDWQGLLTQLNEHGLPLMFVLFEGAEDLLPYWQTWAGWTGGAAATAESGNLVSTVVELARRGATAALPQCPPGQSRDEARRCRPYSDWLGYSFKNGNLPAWARSDRLGRDDVLTKEIVQRTFSDVKFPAWWAFWREDPRQGWWEDMEGFVCYGMALSGGRFSTALQPFRSSPDGRSAASWEVSRTPLLPGPVTGTDTIYKRELLQTLATDYISQESTEAKAALLDQERYFASRAKSGGAAAAMRSQLESVMASGRGNVGSSSLASERPAGLALVAMWGPHGGGHAVVAYNVRDTGGGGFQIDVWDNEEPGKVNWIPVSADGSWSYGPAHWTGGPGSLLFLPEYPARGLHLDRGGTTASGREVTIADVPAGATVVHAGAETSDGARTDVHVQPNLLAPGADAGSAVVTDGSRLQLTLTDRRAGATARGSGTILDAEGLTGGTPGAAEIDYDVDRGTIETQSPDTGTLAVTRGRLHVSSSGASGLGMSGTGTTTVKSRRGGHVALVVSSAVDGSLRSATFGLVMPHKGSFKITGHQAKGAIRHGGNLGVIVRSSKGKRSVRVVAHPVAHSYSLRASVRVKHRHATVALSALRRLPKGSEGLVRWTVSKGKRILRHRSIQLEHPRTGHPLGKIRLPRAAIHGAVVKAVVRVVVKRPGPAELVAMGSYRVGARHRH
jgi:hypothetical protein